MQAASWVPESVIIAGKPLSWETGHLQKNKIMLYCGWSCMVLDEVEAHYCMKVQLNVYYECENNRTTIIG